MEEKWSQKYIFGEKNDKYQVCVYQQCPMYMWEGAEDELQDVSQGRALFTTISHYHKVKNDKHKHKHKYTYRNKYECKYKYK